MLEDEDARPRPSGQQPRQLAPLSIEELEAYIAQLRAEIARVEVEIGRRREVRGAAEALFKRPGG
jgi:uncharacterized small protein (DUF1192 family)